MSIFKSQNQRRLKAQRVSKFMRRATIKEKTYVRLWI
jgi:hypothetical protein